MAHLWQHPAHRLAALIASREVSSREVVEAHLARIEEVNPRLNALVRVLAPEARSAADAADRKVAAREPLGPLHGVPITVKANIDQAGVPTTWGVPALANAVPPLDAPVVQRMRAAGAIPIGRTNLPDMALRVHTDSSLYGLTRNPWSFRHTAGGSSGGEAAALASGMSPLGLGNDIGGSLRNPASACGIASIRPSAGRVPDAGVIPAEEHLLAVQLMNVQGPMARTVADVRIALGLIAGADPRDPWSITAPLEGAPLPRPIRVAMVPSPPGGSCDPVVAQAVRRAGAALAAAGYEVVETCPPRYEEAVAAWARLIIGDFSVLLPQLLPLLGAGGRAYVEAAAGSVPPLGSAAALSELMLLRDGIARAWSRFLAEYPLILTPTWTQLPFEHGFDAATPQGSAATMELTRPVVPANLLGLPSACVPASRDAASGLPIGVLLTGNRFREDTCLDAAEIVESACGFSTPIDPVWRDG